MRFRGISLIVCALLTVGCVSSHPDRFYALERSHAEPLAPRSSFAMQLHLRVSIPSMVDRNELVLSESGGITILEHERWAAPLSEQLSSVLGQDIEARRQDVIVTSRSIAEPQSPAAMVAVDVVQISLQRLQGCKMEARWRIQRGSEVTQGRESFSSHASGQSYAALVQSLDDCLGLLADRVVSQLPQ